MYSVPALGEIFIKPPTEALGELKKITTNIQAHHASENITHHLNTFKNFILQ